MFTKQSFPPYILYDDMPKLATFLSQTLTDFMELCALRVTPMGR